MTKETRTILQHKFNVAHFYCRLCNLIGRKRAGKFCRFYESLIHKLLYVPVEKEKLMFK